MFIIFLNQLLIEGLLIGYRCICINPVCRNNDYFELLDKGRRIFGSISFLSIEPFLFFNESCFLSSFDDLTSVDRGFTRAESLESSHTELDGATAPHRMLAEPSGVLAFLIVVAMRVLPETVHETRFAVEVSLDLLLALILVFVLIRFVGSLEFG